SLDGLPEQFLRFLSLLNRAFINLIKIYGHHFSPFSLAMIMALVILAKGCFVSCRYVLVDSQFPGPVFQSAEDFLGCYRRIHFKDEVPAVHVGSNLSQNAVEHVAAFHRRHGTHMGRSSHGYEPGADGGGFSAHGFWS